MHNKVFFETSAFLPVIEEILIRFKKKNNHPYNGMLIVGVGLFPGLSNILAKEVNMSKKANSIELGIKMNPLSSAGKSMCRLMSTIIYTNCVYYLNSQRVEDVPVSKGEQIFNNKSSVKTGFPESVMLFWSMQVPNTAVYFTASPSLLNYLLLFISEFNLRLPVLLKNILKNVTTSSLILLRSFIFRFRPTPVEMICLSSYINKNGSKQEKICFSTNDGIASTVCILAAKLILWSKKENILPGIYLPDDVFSLKEVISESFTQGKGRVRFNIKIDIN
jgi:hypothetical protein